MSKQSLADINVQVESPLYETGNLPSVLTEIKFALGQLIDDNKTYSIDIYAMPWSKEEEEKLEKILGVGEVSVQMSAFGKSIFYETGCSGVWLITHYNPENEIIGKLIEITTMPDMLFSQYEDIKDSLKHFDELESFNESEPI